LESEQLVPTGLPSDAVAPPVSSGSCCGSSNQGCCGAKSQGSRVADVLRQARGSRSAASSGSGMSYAALKSPSSGSGDGCCKKVGDVLGYKLDICGFRIPLLLLLVLVAIISLLNPWAGLGGAGFLIFAKLCTSGMGRNVSSSSSSSSSSASDNSGKARIRTVRDLPAAPRAAGG